MELDDALYGEIQALCEQGNSLVESRDFRGALRLFHRSWELLPEPREEWDAATWILSAIGDVHFFLGDYPNVIAAMSNAIRCPEGLGNPFIHLRLGEAAYELGQFERAKDELTRAFMGAGKEIFASEDPKYLEFLRTILQPMPGQESL